MTAEEYLKALGYSFTFPDGRLDLNFEMEAENVIILMEAYAKKYAKACLERAAENVAAWDSDTQSYSKEGSWLIDKSTITDEANLIQEP
jgi:hypothetical protein